MRKMLTTAGVLLALLAPSQAQQTGDPQICEKLQALAVRSNKEAGKKKNADGTTTHMGMTVSCDAKTVDFKKRIDVPASKLRPDWRLITQWGWNEFSCGNPAYARLIAKGWTISSSLVDSEGGRHVFRATCE